MEKASGSKLRGKKQHSNARITLTALASRQAFYACMHALPIITLVNPLPATVA